MNNDQNNFTALYARLNSSQKKAVDAIEGPVMVIAGPGTGKTQVLALRIANILCETQSNPENILALTFTDSGVTEMRKRLSAIIGPTAYYVNIFTFHGFCNDIIRSYPDYFKDMLGKKSLDEVLRIRLMEKVFDAVPLKLLKPFYDPFFYLKDVLRVISDMKREGVGVEDLKVLLEKQEEVFNAIPDLYHEKGAHKGKMKGKYVDIKNQREKHKEVADIYKAYGEILKKYKVYDYDDMILEVINAMKDNDELLRILQEKFQYILVDEHQDTNNAQNKVVELLGNFYENPNIFVVGDEKQAIFRFQGATLENFLYFKTLYPEAELISLEKNYRSTQSILDAAHSLIINNSKKISDVVSGIHTSLQAETLHENRSIELYEFKKGESEYYFVAKKVAELITAGAPPHEIALIYRDNKEGIALADILARYGIPFRVESYHNILEDKEIRKLITLLRFIENIHSEEHILEILHIDFLGISSLDLYKILSLRRKISLLEFLSDGEKLEKAGVRNIEKITTLTHMILAWHTASKNLTFLEVFEMIVRESGFLAYILGKSDAALHLARLDSLFDEVKKNIEHHEDFEIKDFIAYIDVLLKYGIGIKGKSISFIGEAVRLMTAHGSKGLEFDYVFISNVIDGHWGNKRVRALIKSPSLSVEGNEALEGRNVDDERRLLYVAITRARKMVYLSYARIGRDGREELPSQFLEEIKPEYRLKGESGIYEESYEKEKAQLFTPRVIQQFSVFDKEYLNHLFEERGLSATALNNFLECPWRYFYMNLLRIPRAENRHQIYGKAIHGALKRFFDVLRNREVGEEYVVKVFEEELSRAFLKEKDYRDTKERGSAMLKNYIAHYKGIWTKNTLNEYRINSVMLPFTGGTLKLTGSLDKIEYIGRAEVNVVDYKTGKPKSRNELEGNTKYADGNYKRQLVFYKLLLDEYPLFRDTMISGEIDFLEADTKGVFHKEKFVIEKQEVLELKNQLEEVSNSIRNLSFWNEGCSEKECEFCRLREAVSGRVST